MLTYQEESYKVALDPELIKLHFDEVALHQELIALDPDYEVYESLEASGRLRSFTVRDDGVLVGYSIFILTWNLHYRSTRQADNDLIFLHPEHRKGFTGIDLIRYSEQQLLEYGVDKITWHVKSKNDFGPVLKWLGYGDEERIVAKMIDRRNLWPV